MHNYWTLMKKLIWLKILQGASFIVKTITGDSPITLTNSIKSTIVSLKQYGKCIQNGIPTPTTPVDIVCNNGVIKYGALGQNLLDPSAANTILGYYINRADGEEKSSPYNFMFAGYMPVEAGKTYVAYGRAKSGDDLSDYNRVAWYDSTKTWVEGASYTQNQIAIVTAPENAAYARFSCNPSGGTTVAVTQEIVDNYNWTFCEGNAEIVPFVPFVGGIYTDGTSEMLMVSANLVTSTLSGYGTYVSPSQSATTRAYKWLENLPNGTYQFAVDGDYEIIIQWRDPADPSVTIPSSYENLTGWMTSGVVTLNKSTGGYGIAVRRASGTGSVTPSDFDGTLYCYKVSDIQTVTDIPMLLGVGDYADELDIISGIKTGKVGVKVFNGKETIGTSNACFTIAISDRVASKTALLCSHFPYSTKTSTQTEDMTVISFSSTNIGFRYDACADKTAFATYLAAQYIAETPVIVVYPLAEETEEHTMAYTLHSYEGTTIVDAQTEVDPVKLEVSYETKSA